MVKVVEGLEGVWAGEILQEEEEFRGQEEEGWVFEGDGELVFLEGDGSLWDDFENSQSQEELRQEGWEGFDEKVLESDWQCGRWSKIWVGVS